MKYQNNHNLRNSKGRFTPKLSVRRAPNGRFASPFEIVPGRLYNFKGSTVRALQKDTKTNTRLISVHKTLFGFVRDNELQKIDTRKVKKYLEVA